MTAAGDARRALIGPAAVEASREAAATAPPFPPALLEELAVLLRRHTYQAEQPEHRRTA